MSKHQSFAPDDPEVSTRTEKRSVRKEKRWAVWKRMIVPKDHPRYASWLKIHDQKWWRHGRFATIEKAEEFIENDKRKRLVFFRYEYSIRADELGKPE